MIFDKLYDYQSEAVEFILERDGSAVFFEQGTGKTWVTAGVVEKLAADENAAMLLIVPLANIETTWETTLNKLGNVQVCRTWEQFKGLNGHGPRVLLMHYEAIHAVIKKLAKKHWTLVVYDESQRLKGRGTKQSRDAAKFKNVDHRVVLSGTPIEQAPQDLWAQFRFAVPDVLGTRWADFKSEWLDETGFMGYKLKFRQRKMPEFLNLIRPHIMRVTKKEVLDLPALTTIRCPVKLLGGQARVYRDLEKSMTTTVDGQSVTADMRITQLVRLQQVCGGFVRTDAGDVLDVGRAKLRKLKAICARESAPVVVFCKYLEELDRIVAALSHARVGVICGRTRDTRTTTIEAFQRGELDYLVCQVRSGGVGIDLYRAHTAIFFSTTFSFIDFDQAVSRLHRHGQTHQVKIFLIYGEDTVDADIFQAVLSKQLIADQILTHNKRKRIMAKTKTAAPAPTKTAAAPAEKAEKAPKAEKAEKAPKAEKAKYGVPELAAALGIKPASARVRLRNSEVAKAGKSYGWNTKAEMQEVIDALQSDGEDEKAA